MIEQGREHERERGAPLVPVRAASHAKSYAALDRIVHHLTHVLPANPDDHLGPPLVARPNECYCPLTLQDERPGREDLRVNCQFTVERSNPPPTLRVFHLSGIIRVYNLGPIGKGICSIAASRWAFEGMMVLESDARWACMTNLSRQPSTAAGVPKAAVASAADDEIDVAEGWFRGGIRIAIRTTGFVRKGARLCSVG